MQTTGKAAPLHLRISETSSPPRVSFARGGGDGYAKAFRAAPVFRGDGIRKLPGSVGYLQFSLTHLLDLELYSEII